MIGVELDQMVDLDWKAGRMGRQDITVKPPSAKLSSDRSPPPQPQNLSPRPALASATSAYEQYLRLPELSRLWTARDFPGWGAEPVLKPALQALEITFRLVSVALSDPRPYADRRQWARRLESLASTQIELVAALCEDGADAAPVSGLGESKGVLSRDSSEVWKIPGSTPVVNRTSEGSLLPRLAAWERSEAVASKLQLEIECQMRGSPFTLGLGEPNLSGKPNLDYDLVCRPAELHLVLKTKTKTNTTTTTTQLGNHENTPLYTLHQILESWVFAGRQLLGRIGDRVEAREWGGASADCWLLERVWKLLAEVDDLHMLMDPDDFLRLKSQLGITPGSEESPPCFRSASLLELTRASKDLRRLVPPVLGVEVDPNGGPRVQEAAMRLLGGHGAGDDAHKVHLLQGFQAVESAVKRFFFAYRQLVSAVMGSLHATGNRVVGFPPDTALDQLAQLFLEPPYFPSLDAAKTFLGDLWHHHHLVVSGSGTRMPR